MMVAQYVMVNMLMSVMIQEFENYYFSDDELSLDKFKDNVRSFDIVWARLSKKYGGVKMKSTSLITLFANLKKPLGSEIFCSSIHKNILNCRVHGRGDRTPFETRDNSQTYYEYANPVVKSIQ